MLPRVHLAIEEEIVLSQSVLPLGSPWSLFPVTTTFFLHFRNIPFMIFTWPLRWGWPDSSFLTLFLKTLLMMFIRNLSWFPSSYTESLSLNTPGVPWTDCTTPHWSSRELSCGDKSRSYRSYWACSCEAFFSLFRESLHSLQLPHKAKCSSHPPRLPALSCTLVMTCGLWIMSLISHSWMNGTSFSREELSHISPVSLETSLQGYCGQWPFLASSTEVSHLEPSLFSKARQAKMVPLLCQVKQNPS